MSCADLVVGSKIGLGNLAARSVCVPSSNEIFSSFHRET